MKIVFSILGLVMALSVSCSSRSNTSSLDGGHNLSTTKYYYNVFGVDKPNNAIPRKSTRWFESNSTCESARLKLLKSRLKENLELEVALSSGWFGSEEKLRDVVTDPDFLHDYNTTTFSFPDEDLISKVSPCKRWLVSAKNQ